MTAIRLMADYHCWPLWWDGERVGNIDPAELPLSAATKDALAAWAELYDARLDPDDPAGSDDVSQAEQQAFETEGMRLWRQLQQELGSGYAVSYRTVNGRVYGPA